MSERSAIARYRPLYVVLSIPFLRVCCGFATRLPCIPSCEDAQVENCY